MRLAVFALIILATSAAAQQVSPAERLVAGVLKQSTPEGAFDTSPWSAYPAQPANAALEASDYASYRIALEHGDCEKAGGLVKGAYLQRYPALKPAFTNGDVLWSWQFEVFSIIYPEAALCSAIAGLQAETEQLSAAGYSPPPAPITREKRPYNPASSKRDQLAWEIERLAAHDYVPAIHALFQLADTDGYVRIEAANRLYFLLRLARLGARLDDQDDKTSSAREQLSPAQISAVECAARYRIYFVEVETDFCNDG